MARTSAAVLVLTLVLGSCATTRSTRQADPSAVLLKLAQQARPELMPLEADKLEPAQKKTLVEIARRVRCPCEAKAGTLAECAGPGPRHCARAPFALRAIVRGLSGGAPAVQIEQWLALRYEQPKRQLPPGASPCRGPADAPTTAVVFSDFQCPACAWGRAMVDEAVKRAGKRLRVCYKALPLRSIHPHAQLAAQAAFAAQRQGKFWEFHDSLFDNQQALAREQLIERARALELDVERFITDMEGQETREQVARDVALATALGVRGTPTFFIGGREVTDPVTLADFLDWVAEEAAAGHD